jgi:hypothetical protein
MWLIMREALRAGLLLVGIVWWTMFSGRKGGERPDDEELPRGAGGRYSSRPCPPRMSRTRSLVPRTTAS